MRVDPSLPVDLLRGGAPVSPRADTAIRILVTLARSRSGQETAEVLARAQGVNRRTLDPVLADLAHAGLVVGFRGQAGGYRLGWPAAEITLADVVAAVDRPLAQACGLRPGGGFRDLGPGDALDGVWADVRHRLREVLEGFGLDAIAESG